MKQQDNIIFPTLIIASVPQMKTTGERSFSLDSCCVINDVVLEQNIDPSESDSKDDCVFNDGY
jgi:hypothetical protein